MLTVKDSDWARYSHLKPMDIQCECGGQFQSQAKWVPNSIGKKDQDGTTPPSILVTQDACPKCGYNANIKTAVRGA